MKFKGIIPPVVTLFGEDGQIDMELNRRYIDELIDRGVHGILLLGSSGEFACLTLEERKQYVTEMIKHINHRVPVLVGAGHTAMPEVLELVDISEKAGADGFLVVNPYYWHLTENQLYHYFAMIARRTSLPVLLYNIPQYTGQLIPINVMKKLALDFPNIQGVKETVIDIGHIRDVILEVVPEREDFMVFAAFDDHLLPALFMGAVGSINSIASFIPELPVGIYEAYQRGDYEKARELHQQICSIMELYSYCTTNFTSIKEAVHMRWFSSKPAIHRAPFDVFPEDLQEKVKKILDKVFVTV